MMIEVAEPLAVTTTPSGVEIRYFAEPKRKYELRYPIGHDSSDEEWREVPSVTQVLDVLSKPALVWWGQKVGVEGVLELLRLGRLRGSDLFDSLYETKTSEDATTDRIVELLTEHKLSTNHVRDKAGARGIAVHDCLEAWAELGQMPIPAKFPEEERGYVKGLNKFLADVEPEPVASEVMVGSLEHGFAGRYDLRFRITKECQVVYKHTPKRGDHYAVLQPGLYLGDLKTSKGVYPSHSRQLEAYESASIECGYEPTVARGILHVSSEGHYEFVRSTATLADFLCVLEVWKSDQTMKSRKR